VNAPLGPAQIRDLIPHRYPFLLVDRIEELEAGVRAVGVKNVTQNEPFFQGHFPDYPVMPGVLIIEAMAQVGAVGVMAGGEHGDKLALFAGIDGVRFVVEIVRLNGRVGRGKGRAKVGEERVCEADLMFAFAERGEVR
jgi:3-hydroxyacyl-[acyl-carrier-protein] dehydratase